MDPGLGTKLSAEPETSLHKDVGDGDARKKVAPLLVPHLDREVRKLPGKGGGKATDVEDVRDSCLA